MLFMSVTLDVSKLRGWLKSNAPCRVERLHNDTCLAGLCSAYVHCGGVSSVRRARGGAHVKHAAHVFDAGGVEAQRLVEGRINLRESKGDAYDAGRSATATGSTRARVAAQAANARGNETAQLWRPWGAREAGRERTMNMPCMVVTPEVSQLEILALKLCIS